MISYQYLAIFLFYLKRNWASLLLIFVGWIIVISWTHWGTYIPGNYTYFWDIFIGVLGILLTIGLTVFYVYNEWKAQLPKRLIVHFMNTKSLYIGSCYNVKILPNGELRALGLQVGQQMLQSQKLEFNPSVGESKKEKVYRVKDVNGDYIWIMAYEIIFHLLRDSYNQNSSYYALWNLSEGKVLSKKLPVELQSYSTLEKSLSVETLLSDDKESISQFNSLTEIIQRPKYYLINSPIITSPGTYEYSTLKYLEFVQYGSSDAEIESAIGHDSTAEYLSKILSKPVVKNRMNIRMNPSDQALVIKIKYRMNEGEIYSIEQVEGMEKEFGLLTRVK